MWYNKIAANLGEIPNFITYYEDQLVMARQELTIRGNLERNLANLPGITERYFTQLQEIEAILNYLNIQLRKIRRKYYQQYMEGYARVLTSRDAEKYTDGEQEVVDFECLVNEVALVRNKYLGIMKGLEAKNYMVSNITKLRAVGMEDVNL